MPMRRPPTTSFSKEDNFDGYESVSESVSNHRERLAFAHRVFSILVTTLTDEVMPVLFTLVLVNETLNASMVAPPPSVVEFK